MVKPKFMRPIFHIRSERVKSRHKSQVEIHHNALAENFA